MNKSLLIAAVVMLTTAPAARSQMSEAGFPYHYDGLTLYYDLTDMAAGTCRVWEVYSEEDPSCPPNEPAAAHVIPPKAYDGDVEYEVTAIADRAFQYYNLSDELVIPSTVSHIGEEAFLYSTLRRMEIPESVTTLGDGIFRECRLLSEVSLPQEAGPIWMSVPASMFSGCDELRSISLPDGLTGIGAGAFRGCSALASIDFPSTVSRIDSNAFTDCSSLGNVRFPAGLAVIGSAAFSGCAGITEVTIPANTYSIGSRAFAGTSISGIEIPSTVRVLGSGCFSDCLSLTSAILPDAITSIPSRLFEGCALLSSLRLPARVNTIGESAFSGCARLEQLDFSQSQLTEIGAKTFYGCSSLTKVYLRGLDLERIAERAFYGCSALSGIDFGTTILKSLVSVGDEACADCSSLPQFPFGPALTAIGNGAFRGCRSLTQATLTRVTELGEGAFEGCEALDNLSLPEGATAIPASCFKGCKALKMASLPAATAKIGTSAFEGCMSLENLHLPPSVEEIEACAFKDCASLPAIILPQGIRNLPREVFSGCSSAVQLMIPESMDRIGGLAFAGCDALENVTVSRSVPPVISGDTFSAETCGKAILHVPADGIELYRENPNWRRFLNLQSAVGEIEAESPAEAGRYTPAGVPVDSSYKGLVIVRYQNGECKKIITQ